MEILSKRGFCSDLIQYLASRYVHALEWKMYNSINQDGIVISMARSRKSTYVLVYLHDGNDSTCFC